ncbi:MAG TPA: PIN domain-containing protein [Trueperaceae bacterium]
MSVDFIDSNIFVYLFDETDRTKRETATALVEAAVESGSCVISHQVVHEVLNVITRKLSVPVTTKDARLFFDHVLAPLWHIAPSHELFRRSLQLKAKYSYSFYDSLIVAAALEFGCRRLLTEDLQHGQRIEKLTIVDPFRS